MQEEPWLTTWTADSMVALKARWFGDPVSITIAHPLNVILLGCISPSFSLSLSLSLSPSLSLSAVSRLYPLSNSSWVTSSWLVPIYLSIYYIFSISYIIIFMTGWTQGRSMHPQSGTCPYSRAWKLYGEEPRMERAESSASSVQYLNWEFPWLTMYGVDVGEIEIVRRGGRGRCGQRVYNMWCEL